MRLRDRRGFTLMEMLLALSLFLIISIASTSVFRMGLGIWRRTQGDTGQYRKTVIALEKMRRDIREMIPLERKTMQVGLSLSKKTFEYSGTSRKVQVPAFLISYDAEGKETATFGRVSYEWTPGTGELCRREETAMDLYRSKTPACQPLARGVERFKLRYWMASSITGSHSWYDQWDASEGMPAAVSIRLEWKPKGSRQPAKVLEKTVPIPAGSGA